MIWLIYERWDLYTTYAQQPLRVSNLPFTYHRLSQVEDQLFAVQSKCNYIQRRAIDDLVSANLLLIELLSQFPF